MVGLPVTGKLPAIWDDAQTEMDAESGTEGICITLRDTLGRGSAVCLGLAKMSFRWNVEMVFVLCTTFDKIYSDICELLVECIGRAREKTPETSFAAPVDSRFLKRCAL
jgi:hypothetical protein